jgi:hydrogenase maturation protein HypF
MEPKAAQILVRGIVQGVGFRPACFRLATKLGLRGYVRNLGDASVEIFVEGERIEDFLKELKSLPPPIQIYEVSVKPVQPQGFTSFAVFESSGQSERFSPPPPDLDVCDDCLRELLEPSNRRYLYPFITCMHCGPRFTILRGLPYDRSLTTMSEFPLCEECRQEYSNPFDRRFRAEPVCCPKCGPRVRLFLPNGVPLEVENPIAEAAKLLDEGNILAIKGIGGTHLAVKASEDEPVRRLRQLYHRPQQPFAVMSLDLEKIRKYAEIGELEAELLQSRSKPIVCLKKRENFPLSELLSPGLDTIGVMLPYSPIHFLLLKEGRDLAYVMTSGNLPGLPMAIRNSEAFRLRADYFLLHNRKIENRCDDSVIRVTDGKPTFLRRSRGYVPIPLKLEVPKEVKILALGAELSLTFSIVKDGYCFVSQHIGDLTKYEVLLYLREAIEKWKRLLKINEFDVIVCDLHPQLLSTLEAERLAGEWGCKLVRIQHHVAHLYSLMAEKRLSSMIGIAADGVGYGEDGTIWGGEVIGIENNKYERLAWIEPRPMPGGDLATVRPARMIAGILWDVLPTHQLEKILLERGLDGTEIEAVFLQLQSSLNSPLTSSCGRLLDAASCLLGICNARTYEGEPAMKLEAAARHGDPSCLSIDPSEFVEGKRVSSSALLLALLDELRRGIRRRDLAAWFQLAVGKVMATLAVELAAERGVNNIGVSGGVFYNDLIARAVREEVEKNRMRFHAHEKIPPGDGGVSVGQAFAAAVAVRC